MTIAVALLALATVAGGCHPDDDGVECGGEGTYHDGGSLGRHCAYIVIVGGFRCPEELPYRHDFEGGEVVCSDRETAEEDLPEEVCRAVGRSCRPAETEACRWDAVLGGEGNDLGQSVVTGSDGTVYVALTFEGTVDFGGGPRSAASVLDSALVAFDPFGDYLWDVVLPAASEVSLAADASGLVVSGSFEGTIDLGGGPRTSVAESSLFVLALDPRGGYLWDRVFEGLGIRALPPMGTVIIRGLSQVVIGSDESVRVVGRLAAPIDFGGGVRTPVGGDAFVLALDSLGAYLWDRVLPAAGPMDSAFAVSVARDAGDGLLVAGDFRGSVDFGGGPRVSDGNDGFVVALGAAGAYLWDRVFAGRACADPELMCPIDTMGGVAVLDDGTVVVTGGFADGADFGAGSRAHGGVSAAAYVAAYDGTGAYRWERTYTTESVGSAIVSQGDRVAMTGNFRRRTDFGGGLRTSSGSTDAFVFVLDRAGAYLDDWVLSGVETSLGTSIASTPAGHLVVGGAFTRTADLGHGERSAAALDGFVTRLCR